MAEEKARIEAVMAAYPKLKRWVVGGHTWGAQVGARYAANSPDRVAGVVLWGGRLSADSSLAGSDLPVLMVYGTLDDQNVDLIANNRPWLPEHTVWTRHGKGSGSVMNLPAPDKAIPLLEDDKPKKKVVVGLAEQSDIIIYGSGISKTHAAFLPAPDGSFRLMDMGSANGTAVNGVELEESRPVKLNTGDRVSFWWFQFQFVELDAFLNSLKEPKMW